MTGLWLAIAAVTVLAVAPLVRVLVRQGGAAAPERRVFLLAHAKAQLAELDRDVERGLVAADEAEGLRAEIKRRLLVAAETRHPEGGGADGVTSTRAGGDSDGKRTRRTATALAIGTASALGALALYHLLGSPGVPDQPLAERQRAEAAAKSSGGAMDAETKQFHEAVATLERRLADHPDDVRGWTVLGGAYRAEQRYTEAAHAFGEAFHRSGDDPALASDLAEVSIAAAGGRVDADVRRLLDQALAFDPRDVRARFYAALAEAQDGNVAAALQGWVDLTALAPPDAPFLPMVRQHIDRAAKMLGVDPASVTPSAAARALIAKGTPTAPGATASPEGQPAAGAAVPPPQVVPPMVWQMVDRLAARLAREPNDRDGWLRLARAYDVLGETAKADDARAHAAALASTPSPTSPTPSTAVPNTPAPPSR